MKPLPSSNMKAKPHAQNVTPQMHVSTMPSTRMLIDSRERESRLEHDEADLHAENEERRDERPRRVDRVDFGRRTARRRLREHGRSQEDLHGRQQEDQADGLSSRQREHFRAHVGVTEVGGDSLPERVGAHERFLLYVLIEKNDGPRQVSGGAAEPHRREPLRAATSFDVRGLAQTVRVRTWTNATTESELGTDEGD
jgi:hypothetical protein